MDRPDGWENPYTEPTNAHYWDEASAYEAGADAMLIAQFRQGELYCLHDNGGLTIKSWACPICRKDLKEALGL